MSTVQIAQHQRHLFLLKKVRGGKTLTPAEITELERFETDFMARKKTPDKPSNSTVAAGSKRHLKRQKPEVSETVKSSSLSEVKIKGWGRQYETMADCEASEKLSFQISALIQGKPKLAKAWEKGQKLRLLFEYGQGNATIPDVEHELEMKPGSLTELFARDPEAAEAFNNGRHKSKIILRKSLVEQVNNGKIGPTVAKQIYAMFEREQAKVKLDYQHIPYADLVMLAGVTRQTIYTWITEFGLSKNTDDTFDLFAFIRWYGKFSENKVLKEPGKFVKKSDDLELLKSEKLRRELDVDKGLLKPVNEVINGFIARAQGVIEYADRKTAEFPIILENQGKEEIIKKMKEFVDGLRRIMLRIPEVLELPAPAAEKLMEVFKILGLDHGR